MKWTSAVLLAILAGLPVATVSTQAQVQSGTIRGVVYDETSGEPLSGASVFLIGTVLGSTTDLDGKFEIVGVPVGIYRVRVSCDGYTTEEIRKIEVTPNRVTELNPRIARAAGGEPGTYKIDDVIISAERVMSNDAALLAARMKSATIGDGISAEQIARSPDASSGDALKRVTGLSVVDDKYVFVRGVTDRYNSTTLNGATVTSTDTNEDKRSFAFDMIPASLMSNSVVVKTATPDLPGDFSGGLVQVNTLEFPPERVINLKIGSTYATGTTGEQIKTAQGGNTDWRGKDDGYRSLPADKTGIALAKALPNNWALGDDKARAPGKFSASYGDRHRLFSQQELGYIAALTYSAGNEVQDFTQQPRRFGDTVPFEEFDGTRYMWGVRWGSILNLNYRPRGRHKFGFKNTYNRVAKETLSQSEGTNDTGGQPLRRQTAQWNERFVYSGLVTGEHTIPVLDDLDIDWRWEYSTSNAKEPDRKRVEYALSSIDNTTWSMKENSRSWAELQEDTRGGGVDVRQEWAGKSLKAGYKYRKRDRTYNVDSWYAELPSYIPGRSLPAWDLLSLPLDQIFDADNFGKVDSSAIWGGPADGFNFLPQTVFTGAYEAEAELKAYYGMLDLPFYFLGEQFRLVGGARAEDMRQRVLTKNADAPPTESKIDTLDVLPSANFTWMFSEKVNVRLGYYKSVNRPEFREMSDVLYFNFNEGYLVRGNPNLQRAVIQNFDVRLEWFPNPGEVIAFSYFYKDIEKAIEVKLRDSPERALRTWFNAPDGKNQGYELEFRKSLGFVHRYANNLSFLVNYTRVESEVKFEELINVNGILSPTEKTRPLQGQAPWMFNTGFFFYEPTIKTSFSLLYNRIGRRLDVVADEEELNVYEEPRHQVDLALTQILGRFKTKFTIENMLGEESVYTMQNGEDIHREHSNPTRYSLSLSFDL